MATRGGEWDEGEDAEERVHAAGIDNAVRQYVSEDERDLFALPWSSPRRSVRETEDLTGRNGEAQAVQRNDVAVPAAQAS